MILANLRERLTEDDVQLVLDRLSRGDPTHRARLEAALASRGPDALLDDPDLPRLLRGTSGLASPSAPLFIYVCVRHTLLRSGVRDLRLADYLAALVYDFGFRERATRVTSHDDQTYRYLTDLVADAEHQSGRRGFLLLAHLGNFALWLAGIFPDRVTFRQQRRGGPAVTYYETLGTRGFRLASDHHLARELDLADIYAAAADRFGTIRVALNRLADQAFFPAVVTTDRVLRQISDDTRHPPSGPALF